MDVEDLSLPRRIVLADQCRWLYRGDGCGYNGYYLLYDINDNPLPYGPPYNNRGGWDANASYNYGDMVSTDWEWVEGFFIAQVFVCVYPNTGQTPPATGNSGYWVRDECSLNLSGCLLRFNSPSAQYGGYLPFGGFPGVQLQPIQLGD
jgi:phage-related protein